jgi:hypothetical protein
MPRFKDDLMRSKAQNITVTDITDAQARRFQTIL